ncbi:MAG: hypothetical protein KJO32_03390 [Deltaproteobacteria bacterium]|nr:hypothetical protein [Deltaproteobacteria bacterium]NNK56816.1 hypothetical protein [Desulfofustis sp.]
MENIVTLIIYIIIGGLGLYLLYLVMKYWKFVLVRLVMPMVGMVVMAFIMTNGQFSDTVHPVLLGMAGVGIGGLTGHWVALKKNWE